ncbi:MAG: hypothetical protein PHV53_05825 [Fermentimonas sp.]|nr:hypothetical protein [Fermentimonas sp.]
MRFLLLLLTFCSIVSIQAQDYMWKLGLDYFFDNREYEKSSYIEPQTLNGIWFTPSGGITWDSAHTIVGGVDLLKIPGMKKAIDKVDITLFYQYNAPNTFFRAGSFPRRDVLSNYSDFFFSDSVNYFTPLMQGLFWQIGKERNFFNAWMDWTGYATPENRESFFIGFSGKTARGILFGDFQSYLFHYAGTNPGNPIYGVSEQMQGIASIGVEFESANSLKGLLSVGVFAGIERDRKADIVHKPVGFISRANLEFWGIGTENTFYTGDPRMRFYNQYGRYLYWGTPFLQGTSYLKSKFYIRFMETDRVSIQLNGNLHFTEGNVLFQQTLTLSASIDNITKDSNKRTVYPWMRIFQ